MFSLSWFWGHLTCWLAFHLRVFFREAIMVFDGTQTPAGVSVVHTEASPAPSSFLFLCGVTSWRSRLCDVNPWPSWALPNGFVLCSRPTWYFPKPSIYCWSPVQVINGLTELWVSVTKKGHMLWAELPKESLERKLSHPDGGARGDDHILQQSWFILIYCGMSTDAGLVAAHGGNVYSLLQKCSALASH